MYVLQVAVGYVGVCGNQDDIPAMLMMLNDPDSSIRHLALHDLKLMGNAGTIRVMEIYLEQNSEPNERLPCQKLLNDRIPDAIQEIRKRLDAKKTVMSP